MNVFATPEKIFSEMGYGSHEIIKLEQKSQKQDDTRASGTETMIQKTEQHNRVAVNSQLP